MSAQPLFEHRVDWDEWQAQQVERACEACGSPFRPKTPRQRFCRTETCTAPPPGVRRRRPRTSGPTRAQQARMTGIQGMVADLLLMMNRSDAPAGTPEEIARDVLAFIRLDDGGHPEKAREAAVRLIAAVTSRCLELVPPPMEPPPDPPAFPIRVSDRPTA